MLVKSMLVIIGQKTGGIILEELNYHPYQVSCRALIFSSVLNLEGDGSGSQNSIVDTTVKTTDALN